MNRQFLLSPLQVMLFCFGLLLGGAAWGQACTPNTSYVGQATGIYPLPDQSGPLDTFICTEQGGEAIFTVVVPDSLTSPTRLDLTTLRISGISGLPSGMTFANNVTFYSPNPRNAAESTTDATFADRSIGCFRIYIPPGATLGDYGITVTAVINGFLPVTFGNGSLVPGRYSIRIGTIGSLGSCGTNISPANPTICRGATTTLAASIGASYRWNTGAVTNSITVSPVFTTSYTVTVTSTNGVTNTASTTVSVSQAPNLSLTQSNSNICSNSSDTLNVSGGNYYVWSNGAVTSRILLASLPSGANIFTVTGTSAIGCVATASISVNVLSSPTVTIGNVSTLTCLNPSTTIIASGASTYSWIGGPAIASRTVTSAGPYTVVGTGSNGCTASASVQVIGTTNPPNITFNSPMQLTCNNLQSTITASGASTYSWIGGPSTASLAVTSAGTYTVVGTGSNGCAATASAQVTSNTNPPSVTVTGPAVVCVGAQFNLSATGADTYSWSSGLGGGVSAYTAPQIPGAYLATVVGSLNSNGCTVAASYPFTVTGPPQTTILPSTSIGCIGTVVTLTAGGGQNYQWSNGASTPSINVSPSANTTYVVTAYNSASCFATASYTLNMVSPPIITLQSLPSVLCGTQSATVTGVGNASGFLWSDGTRNNNITVNSPGTYNVTATSPQGCTSTSSIVLSSYPNCGGYLSIEADPICNYFDTLTVRVFVRAGVDVFSAYANLDFDNSVLRLVTNSPGTYLGSNVINTPPVVSGSVIDFGMTKTAGQQGSNGDGELYSFRFVLDRLPTNVAYDPANPNSVSTLFQLSNISCYNRSGTQPPSFTAISNVNASAALRYLIPLWPGDLNNDKRVNVADLLLIGTNYGQTGPARPTTGLQWQAQPAPLWGFDLTRPNGTAYRCFVDGNGDGIINLSDQSSIGFNLGRTHQLVAPGGITVAVAEPGYVNKSMTAAINVELPDSVIQLQQLPMTKVVTVTLGSAQTPLNGVYGVAFDLEFDADFVNTNGILTNYSGSIFGVPNTDFIKIEDPTDISNGRLSIGMTRYNTTAINAAGSKLLTISVPFIANPTRPWFKVRTTPIACNDQAGNNLTVAPGIDSMRVNGVVGIDGPDEMNSDFSIYPNPTSGAFTLELLAQPEDNATAIIYNALGQLISTHAISSELTELQIDAPAGAYYLRLTNGKTEVSRVIIKQ